MAYKNKREHWPYLDVKLLRVHLNDLLDAPRAGGLERRVDGRVLVGRPRGVHVGACEGREEEENNADIKEGEKIGSGSCQRENV